jgi:Zn-dependent protease with chaperone function
VSRLIELVQGALVLWAQALELYADRLESANGGATTPRAIELRAMAADKRAQAFDLPHRLTDRNDFVDATSESVLF